MIYTARNIKADEAYRIGLVNAVYTQEELERVSHNYELKESDSTVFCMDYAMNGIGSNSCGPDVMDKYRFDEEAFQFQFELIPFVRG